MSISNIINHLNNNYVYIQFRYLPSILYFLIVISLSIYFLNKSKRCCSILFFILSIISFSDIVIMISENDIFSNPDLTYSNEFGGISYFPIINNTKLHIRCFDYNNNGSGNGNGTGTKTILFEAGTPFYSTIWGNVLNDLKNRKEQRSDDNVEGDPMNEIKQYCIYDRYGYGWSDLKYYNDRDKGINGLDAVNDLKLYLNQIGINDHLILVGWSYGGILSQLFVSQYPSMVDGILLVDTMGLMDLNDSFLSSLINQGIISFKILKYLLPSGITRILTSQYPLSSGYLNMDDSIINLSNRLKYSTDVLYQSYNNIDASKNELSIIMDSLNYLNSIVLDQNNKYGNSEFMSNKSLVVLTAADNGTPDWVDLQFEITHYSSNSIQIVNNSSNHFMPLEASQSIVNSISLCIVMSN